LGRRVAVDEDIYVLIKEHKGSSTQKEYASAIFRNYFKKGSSAVNPNGSPVMLFMFKRPSLKTILMWLGLAALFVATGVGIGVAIVKLGGGAVGVFGVVL